MKRTEFNGWRLLAMGLIPALMSMQAGAAANSSCDRRCMREVLDQYLQAVFSHDPTKAPLAANSRATLNAAGLHDGEGIWQTATKLGAVQRRYFDTTTGEAAYFGILEEGVEPIVVSLRLKIVKRKITEAEWTVARKEFGGLFSPQGLIEQPPPPDVAIPTEERTGRAALKAAADAYFEGLQTHDASNIPHVSGCDRIENGTKVTNRLQNAPLSPIPDGASTGGTAVAASAQTLPVAPGIGQESRSGDCASGFEKFEKMILETFLSPLPRDR